MKNIKKHSIIATIMMLVVCLYQSSDIYAKTPLSVSNLAYVNKNLIIQSSVNRILTYLPKNWKIPNISDDISYCGSVSTNGCTTGYGDLYINQDAKNLDDVILHELVHYNLKDKFKNTEDCYVTAYGETNDWEFTAEAVSTYVYGGINFRSMVKSEKLMSTNNPKKYFSQYICMANLYEDIKKIFNNNEFYYFKTDMGASNYGEITDERKTALDKVSRLFNFMKGLV